MVLLCRWGSGLGWGLWEFNRTPKGHERSVSGHPRINGALLIGEILTFLYSAATLLVGIRLGNWLLVPINFTACVGFGMVIYWSWREREAVNACA